MFLVDSIRSSDVLVIVRGNTTGVAGNLDKAKASGAELEVVETINASQHEGLLHEVKERHSEEISVRKENSAENVD